MIVPRSQLTASLLWVRREDVLACAERVSERFEVRDLDAPENGIALLSMEDGALGDAFNAGEIPLSISHVSLKHCETGREVEGGAVVMRDDPALARAIAVIDASLQQDEESDEELTELLREGAARQRAEHAMRTNILNRTRVDFTLLAGGTDAG